MSAQAPAQPDPRTDPGTRPADLTQITLMPIEITQQDAVVVLQVMAEAGISQERAARELNINPGTMSRIVSGMAAVPFQLVRWLWQQTGDDRLLSLLGAGNAEFGIARYRRAAVPLDLSLDEALSTVLRCLSSALDQSKRGLLTAAASDLETANCLLAGVKHNTLARAAEANVGGGEQQPRAGKLDIRG